MNKPLKIILTLVVVIGLLFAAAVIILPRVIDPNNYRDKIVELVKDKTGMELVIDGRIDLSFFPWLGLQTGQLILSDPGYPDTPALMQVKESNIRIKLLPLLKKQVEADTVVLDGLKVNLITFKDGQTNWAKLAGGGKPEEVQPAKPESAAIAFAVAGLKINDGFLRLDDRKAGQSHTIEHLNLKSGAIRPGSATSLNLTANVTSSALPQPVDIDTEFDISVADDMSTAKLSDLAVSLVDQNKRKADLTLDQVDITIEPQKFDLSGLTLSTSGLPINGKLNVKTAAIDLSKESADIATLDLNSDAGDASLSAKVSKMMSAPAVSSQFQFSKVDLAKIVAAFAQGNELDALKQIKNINLSGAASYDNNRVNATQLQGKLALSPSGAEPVNVSFKAPAVIADLNAQTADIQEIKVASEVLNLTASAKGRYNPENPDLSGRFSLPATNIKRLLKLLDIDVQTTDPAAMTNIALSSPFQYRGKSASFTSLTGHIDDTPLSGNAGVTLGDKMTYRFNLKLGKLNADRYLPPEQKSAAAAPTAAKTVSGAEMLAAPIGLAKDMNMDGEFSLEQLKTTGFTLNNLVIGVNGSNGLVRLSPLQASLYEGKMTGSASFDASKANPPIALKLNLNDMQIGTVLKELEVTDKLEARGEMTTNISLVANNRQPLIHTLSGPVQFKLRDGLIKGFDLRKIIVNAQSLVNQTSKYKGKLDNLASEAKAEDSDQFRFTDMSGSVVFNNGVGRNEDLSIKSPLFRITGDGNVDLPDEKIDYHMNVFVVQSLKGQGGEELDQLKGADIPVWIHGSLTDPGFQVDLGRLLKKELKKELTKKLNKAILKNIGGGEAANDAAAGTGKSNPKDEIVRDLGKKLLDGLFK